MLFSSLRILCIDNLLVMCLCALGRKRLFFVSYSSRYIARGSNGYFVAAPRRLMLKWRVSRFSCISWERLVVHREEEFFVARCAFEAVFEEFHGFYRVHVGKVAAKYPHAVEGLLVEQQVVAACAGCVDVDGGEDALVGQFTV